MDASPLTRVVDRVHGYGLSSRSSPPFIPIFNPPARHRLGGVGCVMRSPANRQHVPLNTVPVHKKVINPAD